MGSEVNAYAIKQPVSYYDRQDDLIAVRPGSQLSCPDNKALVQIFAKSSQELAKTIGPHRSWMNSNDSDALYYRALKYREKTSYIQLCVSKDNLSAPNVDGTYFIERDGLFPSEEHVSWIEKEGFKRLNPEAVLYENLPVTMIHCGDESPPVRQYAGAKAFCLPASDVYAKNYQPPIVIQYTGTPDRYYNEDMESYLGSVSHLQDRVDYADKQKLDEIETLIENLNSLEVQYFSRAAYVYCAAEVSSYCWHEYSRYLFYDSLADSTYVIDSKKADVLIASLSGLKQLTLEKRNNPSDPDSPCQEGAKYEEWWTGNNQAHAEVCANALSKQSYKAYEAILCEHNWLTYDDYCVVAVE